MNKIKQQKKQGTPNSDIYITDLDINESQHGENCKNRELRIEQC